MKYRVGGVLVLLTFAGLLRDGVRCEWEDGRTDGL